jgi:hypothetical protein
MRNDRSKMGRELTDRLLEEAIFLQNGMLFERHTDTPGERIPIADGQAVRVKSIGDWIFRSVEHFVCSGNENQYAVWQENADLAQKLIYDDPRDSVIDDDHVKGSLSYLT